MSFKTTGAFLVGGMIVATLHHIAHATLPQSYVIGIGVAFGLRLLVSD